MTKSIIDYRTENAITQAALAVKLGVQAPAISKWENGKVPPERVLDVEKITGISRHNLRPDIFGKASP